MPKILLYSPLGGVESIIESLQKGLPYRFEICLTETELYQEAKSSAVRMIVYDTSDFGPRDMKVINELRIGGFRPPVLVSSKEVSINHYGTIFRKRTMHHLAKPYNDEALLGLTRKLLSTGELPQQRHRRYLTSQSTHIETLSTGEGVPSEMVNLSVGGALCQFEKQPPFVVGDLVRLKVSLDKMESSHTLNAKVVWKTNPNGKTDKFGIGLVFVKYNDIYRELLGKM